MKTCQRCSSERILSVCGKVRDCCSYSLYGGRDFEGFPYDMNLGEGEYLEFKLCLECGQLQGTFPLPVENERPEGYEEEEEETVLVAETCQEPAERVSYSDIRVVGSEEKLFKFDSIDDPAWKALPVVSDADALPPEKQLNSNKTYTLPFKRISK